MIILRGTLVVVLVAHGGLAISQERDRNKRSGSYLQRMLKEFDANDDGRLDEAERSRARETMKRRSEGERPAMFELLRRFDRNRDGQLGPQERAAMRRQMERFGGNPATDTRKGNASGARPGGVPMRLNQPELAGLRRRYDTDGDGKLNDEERAAALQALARFRSSRPDAGSEGNSRASAAMRRFDKDGDGRLSEAERAAMRAQFGGGQRGFGGFLGNSDASDKDRVDKTSLLSKFDADGDGELGSDERAAARAAFQRKSHDGTNNGDATSSASTDRS